MFAVTLIVFQKSCDSECPVAPPQGAVGWSAVCDCGIFCVCLWYFLIIVTCFFYYMYVGQFQ